VAVLPNGAPTAASAALNFTTACLLAGECRTRGMMEVCRWLRAKVWVEFIIVVASTCAVS
jgi:hypothetical protein